MRTQHNSRAPLGGTMISKGCFWQISNIIIKFVLRAFLYTFKPVCRTTFKTPWGKLQNLLEMNLTTDITLLFPSAVNNDIFVYLSCYRCGL